MPAVAVSRVNYRAGSRQATHADDRVQISLVLRGGLVERVGRHEERAGPLSLVVKARGIEHADDYGPDGTLISSLALEGDDGERVLDHRARLPEWQWSPVSPALRPMLRLTARVQGARTAFDPDDPDVLDVLAAVTAQPLGSSSSGLPGWIARVRQRLDDGDLARVRTIAHDEGVHPVYLARAFRRWFGCSVAGYLNRARVARAAVLMAQQGARLTHVAHAAGFSDQAHFCHRFKEASGMAPGRFRRLSASSISALDGPSPRD